jgi:hypothetical protein
MSLVHAVTARKGHMENGEYVSDWLEVTVTDPHTLQTGKGEGADEAAASEAARADFARKIDEAEALAAEDPAVRLARLEAIVREAGLCA